MWLSWLTLLFTFRGGRKTVPVEWQGWWFPFSKLEPEGVCELLGYHNAKSPQENVF